jgi:hypothetical protein
MVVDPEPYTHYRAGGGAPVERGVYRVVGTDDERVRLLYVADAEGNRETTGRVVSVERTELLDSFADAANPDAGVRPWQLVDGMVEEIRMVGRWVGRLVGGR